MEGMDRYLWLIVALPFIGAALNLFFGRLFPKALTALIACASVFGAFLIAVGAFLDLRRTGLPLVQILYDWISITGKNGFAVQAAFKVDQLSAIMILVVTGVGFLIHLYSIGYMADEKRYSRYFSYLNLFTGFMLMLVLAKNLLVMFVGWEGVGLCSYLLIGFWFEKKENAVAGMKAFIVNRVGDFGFTIGVLTLFVTLGTVAGVWTVDFDAIKEALTAHGEKVGAGLLTLVGILLFVGACGKSAQIPLYVWLPDAMAGPTPVSALIHAATMVTAGVYMIARMNFLYTMAPAAMAVVAVVGGLTAIFAATIGLVQNDIKKVLAYSTVSQLGYMFLGVGVGAFAAGIFHLMTHAFFKACLFLGSGSVIHGMGGEQDIRKMGGLRRYMPWTFRTFSIATLAIAGIFPLAGFFSKDGILWGAFGAHGFAYPLLGKILWGVGVVAAGFTAFYMSRLVFMVFFGELRAEHSAHGGHGGDHGGHGDHGLPHESPFVMVLPLVLLALFSICGGWVGIPHALGGGDHFSAWLDPVFSHGAESHAFESGGEEGEESAALEYALMAVSLGAALAGIFLAWLMYVKSPGMAERIAERWRNVYKLLLNKYWIDELYEKTVLLPLIKLNNFLGSFDFIVVDGAVNGSASVTEKASNVTGVFDNDVVDGAVNGTGATVKFVGKHARKHQTGNIKGHLATAFVGLLAVVIIFCIGFILKRHYQL